MKTINLKDDIEFLVSFGALPASVPGVSVSYKLDPLPFIGESYEGRTMAGLAQTSWTGLAIPAQKVLTFTVLAKSADKAIEGAKLLVAQAEQDFSPNDKAAYAGKFRAVGASRTGRQVASLLVR